MARDRLAALRAQQEQAGSGGYGGSSSPSYTRVNQQDSGRYEMSEVPRGDDLTGFYAEISSIKDAIQTFNENVKRVDDLQSQSLTYADEEAAQGNAAQLASLVAANVQMRNELRSRLKALETQATSGRDAHVRRQQTEFVRQKFVEAIQQYQQVEQQYQTRVKQRIERQFKIVKQDATPEEIQAVLNGGQNGQIFTQALLNSDRYGESRAAYQDVQARHADIVKIERTLVELSQLLVDMALLVEKQGEQVDLINDNAKNIDEDIVKGVQHIEESNKWARAWRKKKWICLFLTLIILIIIAAIVVGVVCKNDLCVKQQ